ncbi:Pescadillo -like protein [Trichinella patagoniensis]|uniref:Pescadillo homolog n=1 Tax=Trichinella patagoniensis TaxID=990121 RepID=A0A0V1AC12_9BILA|nr:Pescadillo -like protein [Trichinella patagoniensis]
MGKILKKYERGEATSYISRQRALRKLGLTLKDFRRLCILKGIYPHEPKHKKRVNKGGNVTKTWYLVKDVCFLAHEPIIQKFREYKVFLRRLRRAKLNGQIKDAKRIFYSRPVFKYDHIVKERYPTFMDALRDLDDALCMCFLFSRLHRSKTVPSTMPHTCRRLTVEFMHYVIHSKSLRKVFVSIKGIYFQADIMGNSVTWIVPHDRCIEDTYEVDMSVMTSFIDFYMTMMGFVNFRLYRCIGLHYPPTIGKNVESKQTVLSKNEGIREKIYSLNENLVKEANDTLEELSVDEFPVEGDESDSVQKELIEQMRSIEVLQNLFAGFKIFLNREVPREALTFVIRCCGGEVSWDPIFEYGSKFSENDETITHQVVDRPTIANMIDNRIYIQPQWIFDCVNARMLLPVEDYYVGVKLPPHLSPFTEEKEGDYVPIEKIKLLEYQGKDVSSLLEKSGNEKVNASLQARESNNQQPSKRKEKKESMKMRKARKAEIAENPLKALEVKPGVVHKDNRQKKLAEEKEELRLREMMIAKKYRRAYQKIRFGQKRQAKEVRKLVKKRKTIEEAAANGNSEVV